MAAVIETQSQTLVVRGVTKVVSTAIVDGDAPGTRVRGLQVYTADQTTPALVLKWQGDGDAAVQIPTPEGRF